MTIENTNIFKIGGSILNSEESLARLIHCLKPKIKPGKTIIIHGGGSVINSWLEKIGMEPEFIEGQRVTDETTIQVVEMVLSGLVNKQMVSVLQQAGYSSVGISGRDGDLASARVLDERFGHVGKVERVNPGLLFSMMNVELIPVLSPVCAGSRGNVLNVNADLFACEIAIAVGAKELNLVTATGGVLDGKEPVKHIAVDEVSGLKDNKIVSEGMIPKLHAAAIARKGGVEKVNMLNYEGEIGTCIL